MHTQEVFWTRYGKKDREGQGGTEKDQKVKLSDWSIAQQQVLTSETLGFTAVRMGLPRLLNQAFALALGVLKEKIPLWANKSQA